MAQDAACRSATFPEYKPDARLGFIASLHERVVCDQHSQQRASSKITSTVYFISCALWDAKTWKENMDGMELPLK